VKLLSIGLSEHDHNASYFDGSSVRYHKFERTKQIKHFRFTNAWEWIHELESIWNFDISEIDEIAIDFNPFIFTDGPIEYYDDILKNKVLYAQIPDIHNPFKFYGVNNIWHLNHHYSHSLSTWMLESKDNKPTTRVVIDGIGDGNTVSVFKGDNLIKIVKIDNGSIGMEMENVGQWLGVKSNLTVDMAGKVMGLQSYGNIDYGFFEKISQYNIEQIKEIFDTEKWKHHKDDELLHALTPLDWIRTVHEYIGDLLVNFFGQFANENEVISYTGGVAQNVVWNTKLLKNFKNIIIPPHSSDEGTSLGSLEFLRIKNNLPEFQLNDFPYIQNDYAPDSEPTEETIKFAAEMLANNKIVGWYQKNGEAGPRALGNRSILMNATIPDGKKIINNVKKRENYRPFGASVLEENVLDYFENNITDPYMLFTNKFKNNNFPSITHIDGTCRVQTVKKDNSAYRKLIEEFYKLTGNAIILNTSLNINGKPISGYPQNAIELFYSSPIDYMIIGNTILKKENI
jgi:carbamoyltransferase